MHPDDEAVVRDLQHLVHGLDQPPADLADRARDAIATDQTEEQPGA